MAFSLFLGGASRQHELRLALIELAALPVLILGLSALLQQKAKASELALFVLAGITLVPLIQLIHLPPAVWTGLPGREQSVLALNVAGIAPGWSPLTLTPDRTWRSFLALVPPIAMFVGVLAASGRVRLRLAQLLVGGTLLAIMLGAAQLASGGERLYPWSTTDAGNVVGFFANRNHMATLCLISLPFAAVLGARAIRHGSQNGRTVMWLSAFYIALALVTLGVIRSRAGVLLAGPTLAVSILAMWIGTGRGRPKPAILAVLGGAAAAVVIVAVFALGPILARFDTTGAVEGRFENWPIVAEAANTYLPLGSGVGSFDAVYRSVEPLETLDSTFFNQAHNEYLETWLEAGWLGIAVLAAFLVWFGKRSWTAWLSRASTARDLQRAATIAIALTLIHSVGDYPLRTETIATIFALCCALLELAARSDSELTRDERAGRGKTGAGRKDRRAIESRG